MIPRRWLLLLLVLGPAFDEAAARAPIFIIPGFMASSLQAKYTPAGTPADAPVLSEAQWQALLLQQAAANPAKTQNPSLPLRTSSTRGSSAAEGPIFMDVNQTDGAADNATDAATSQPPNTLSSSDSSSSQDAEAPAVDAGTADDCLKAAVDGLHVWLPSATLARVAPKCWFYLTRLKYVGSNRTAAGSKASTSSSSSSSNFRNNEGAEVWVDSPGASSMRYPLFNLAGYTKLVQFIETTYNYTSGEDLFALPYDFRQDCSTMQAGGHLQRLAQIVSAQVAKANGTKAILIGHSMGSIVGLKLLRDTTLRDDVQGFIALAPPWGGSAASIPARVSGSFDYLLPWLVEELTAVLGGADMRSSIHAATKGMPSMAMMMPYAEAFGGGAVSVTVGSAGASKAYTVNQLGQLLKDIGEDSLAEVYDQVHDVSSLVAGGPIPGVSTFCIYGNTSDTPLSWRYDAPLVDGQLHEVPRFDVMGKGDGVVNLESLRLCRSVAGSPAQVMELPSVSHFSVYSRRSALKAVRRALDTLIKQRRK